MHCCGLFRFFFGKNKVMSLALGRNRSDEYRPGLRKIARRLQGQTGLLFTNASEQQVLRYVSNIFRPPHSTNWMRLIVTDGLACCVGRLSVSLSVCNVTEP